MPCPPQDGPTSAAGSPIFDQILDATCVHRCRNLAHLAGGPEIHSIPHMSFFKVEYIEFNLLSMDPPLESCYCGITATIM